MDLDLTEAYEVAAVTWRCHGDPELEHALPDVRLIVSEYLIGHPTMRAVVQAVAQVVERLVLEREQQHRADPERDAVAADIRARLEQAETGR